MTATRIVIADDQPAIRHGFRLILDAQPDTSITSVCSTSSAPRTPTSPRSR
jgi:DNA-binding NarL/FixJ family response regulator